MNKALNELSSSWNNGISKIDKELNEFLIKYYGINVNNDMIIDYNSNKNNNKYYYPINNLMIHSCEIDFLSFPFFVHNVSDKSDDIIKNNMKKFGFINDDNNYNNNVRNNYYDNSDYKSLSNSNKNITRKVEGNFHFMKISNQYKKPLPCLLFSNQFISIKIFNTFVVQYLILMMNIMFDDEHDIL